MNKGFGPRDKRSMASRLEPFPQELLECGGVIGEIMKYSMSNAHHPSKVVSLAGALAMMSLVASRRYCTEDNGRPNLFILCTAWSGLGKEAARSANLTLAKEIGLVHNICDDFSSGEGLEDKVLAQGKLLSQFDEFETLLQSMTKDIGTRGEGLMKSMLQFWSKSGNFATRRVLAYQNYKGAGPVTYCDHPHFCLFATSVTSRVYEAVSDRMATNGFFARLLIIDAGKRGPLQRVKWSRPPDDLVRVLAKMNRSTWSDEEQRWESKDDPEKPPTFRTVLTTEAAARMEMELDAEVEQYKTVDEDGAENSIWCRAVEKVKKVAMLFALSRDPNTDFPVIDVQDMTLAKMLVWTCTKNALTMLGKYKFDSDFSRLRQKVLRILEHCDRMGRSELLRRLKIPKDDLTLLLDTMTESGEIVATEDRTTTKPVVYYSLFRDVGD